MGEYQPTLDSTNALISIEQAKALIGAKVTDDTQEKALTFYVNAASHYCNVYTDRLLKSRNNTEYYNGPNDDKLFVNNPPITTLTSVHDDQNQAFGSSTLISGNNTMFVVSDGLKCTIAYYGGLFTPGYHNIKVVYTGGYGDGNNVVPYDLQEACLGIAMHYFYQTQEKRFGITSRSIGDGSTAFFNQKIPDWVLSILDGYKKIW